MTTSPQMPARGLRPPAPALHSEALPAAVSYVPAGAAGLIADDGDTASDRLLEGGAEAACGMYKLPPARPPPPYTAAPRSTSRQLLPAPRPRPPRHRPRPRRASRPPARTPDQLRRPPGSRPLLTSRHSPEMPGGPWTLHQLRPAALSHAAEDGASTSTLLACTGDSSVRSLARYARVPAAALGGWQAQRDPAGAGRNAGARFQPSCRCR